MQFPSNRMLTFDILASYTTSLQIPSVAMDFLWFSILTQQIAMGRNS